MLIGAPTGWKLPHAGFRLAVIKAFCCQGELVK
jgi:hypothetical protein